VRTIVLALALLTGAAVPARADVIPIFTGDGGGPFPGNYQLNTPFTFELRAPGLTTFTDFNLDLIVETASLDPVTLMSVEVFRPGDAEYAFGAVGTFDSSQSAIGGSPQFTVNIAGTNGGSFVNITGGVNDVLARIRVTPGPNLNEPVTFYIDAGSYTIGGTPEDIPALQPPDPVTVFPETPTAPAAVPGPGGALLLGVGGMLVLARRRFTPANGTA
jgi:hypothetical protein